MYFSQGNLLITIKLLFFSCHPPSHMIIYGEFILIYDKKLYLLQKVNIYMQCRQNILGILKCK